MAFPLQSCQAAALLVQRAAQQESPLSSMSLHKILFFAQGHSLSLLGKPFVQEPAQAWRFGPLYPRVRDALVRFGADDLARKDGRKALAKLSPIPLLSEEETWFVDAIWNAYGKLSALQLSEMVHAPGNPWREMRRAHPEDEQRLVTDTLLLDYFQERLPFDKGASEEAPQG